MTVIVVQTGFSYFFIESRIFPNIGRIVHSCGILLYDVHYVHMYVIVNTTSLKTFQVLLAFGSTFLRKLFLSRHILEFEVMDFNEATAMLLGRHAGDDITLMLPDFECKTVNRILDFLYSGQCYVTSKTEVETFKGKLSFTYLILCTKKEIFFQRKFILLNERSSSVVGCY